MRIKFIPQYTFNDCKYVYVLRFDFALFKDNEFIGLIEYDGRQHFEPIDVFGGQEGFAKTKKRDEIKNIYCKTHNIPLLRIPYWEFQNDNYKQNFLNFIKPFKINDLE